MHIIVKNLSIYAFILIASVLFIALLVITQFLYKSAFDREKAVLTHVVSSNAYLIDAVARFDKEHSQLAHVDGATGATLSQIQDFVSKYYSSNRNLSEILVVKEVKGGYLILSSFDQNRINTTISESDELFRAIEDLRQNKVDFAKIKNAKGVENLIAFSPIGELHYGLVAKINITKIWEPYKRGIYIAIVASFVLCGFLIIGFLKIVRPIMTQLQDEHQKAVVALENLKINEERLEIALSANNDGIFDWNTVTNDAYFDARYYTMAGYEVNEFPWRLEEWVSRVHPEDFVSVEKALKDYFSGLAQDYDVEFRFKRKDGLWMWIRARVKIFGRSENGEPLRVVGTHTDITALKKAELELREREEMFRNFFELGLVGMSITSIDKKWIEFNETLALILGYTKAELRKKTWSEVTHPADLPKENEVFEQVVAGEVNGYSLEKRFIQKNGDIAYAVISVLAVKNEEGKILYFVALVHDITHLKLTELELRKNEENLSVTLNSIGDAVVSTDINGRVVRMNKVAEILTGFDIKLAKGKKLEEVVHIMNVITRTPIDRLAEKVLTFGEVSARQAILTSESLKEYHISYSGSPIVSDDGNFIGVVLVFRDMTKEYFLQDQLRHSQKMDAIGQLAGGVAHDFNNMLGGILMAASILKKFVPDVPKAQNAHRVIIEASEHAGALTQKLLAFARKQNSKLIAVDLHKIILDTVGLLRDTIDKRIQIKLELKADRSIIFGDVSHLQSAFLNLGINASHAMVKGGVLTIRTKIIEISDKNFQKFPVELKSGVYIQVEVEDTGVGMPPEIMARVFEPFFTTKDVGKGTGLGLAAVYGTIQQQQGSIMVESIEGKGSTFRFFLPLSNENVEVPVKEPDVPSGSGVILIADDERIVREAMAEILDSYGYKVLAVENGLEAVKIFEKECRNIDLVVLDMIMPEMSGLDCFMEMKKIDPDVQVILSSGFSDNVDYSAMQSAGVIDFLRKPFHGEDLARTVYEALKDK